MKIEIVKRYYFENKDKIRFKKWLIDKNTNLRVFAKELGMSLSYLNAIINGTRAINNEIITKFENSGYNILKRKVNK